MTGRRALVLALLLWGVAPVAQAVGVPAGTAIGNSASLSADLGGVPVVATSNAASGAASTKSTHARTASRERLG